MLDLLIKLTTAIGDLVFAVLSFATPAAALVILSAITGVLMLLMWRYTSNQKAIADVRKQISAHLLATRLFKDNLAVTFRAQRQILWQALRLLGHAVRPTLIMMIPFVLIMSQVGLHFEHAPASAARPIRLTARIKHGTDLTTASRLLHLPEGVRCDVQDPCRAAALGTIDWRLTAQGDGDYTVTFGDGADAAMFPLCVGNRFERVSKIRGGPWLDRLLYSAEPSLPPNSVFESIELHYPTRVTPILGLHVHWLVTLLVLSIVFALVAKPILKVHV